VYARRLIIAAIAALVVAPAIAAPTVQREVQGKWCSDGSVQAGEYTGTNCAPEDVITIKPDRYEGREFGCRLTGVRKTYDRDVIASTKTMDAWVARVDAACTGIDCEWRERMTLYVEKGTLYMRDRRVYRRKGSAC
jgi:hypothetical protein